MTADSTKSPMLQKWCSGLLIVVAVCMLMFVTLIVASRHMRRRTTILGTRAMMDKIEAANRRFYEDRRFWAPDAPLESLAGTSWNCETLPKIPSMHETREADSEAPGMPDGKMPTTGNEYMMINLVLRTQHLRISRENLAGPERTVDLGTWNPKEASKVTTRCIIVDSWGRPFFYDCHNPEGQTYVGSRIYHNVSSFDLFSLGPDGRTSSKNHDEYGEEPGHGIGEGPDDLNNWQGKTKPERGQ